MLDWICSSYRALFLCTAQLVVQSALALLDAATRAIADAVRAAGQALEALLSAGLQAAQGTADVAVDALNGVLGAVGQHVEAPQWHEPAALRVLRNITLPPSLVQPFHDVRLPTVDTLRAASRDVFTDALARVRHDVDAAVGGVALAMPPRAAVRALPPVCAHVRWSAFDEAARRVRTLAALSYAAIGVGAAGALALAAVAAWQRDAPPCATRRARTWAVCPVLVWVYAALLLHLGAVQVDLGVAHLVLRRLSEVRVWLTQLPDVPMPQLPGADAATDVANAVLHDAETRINAVLAQGVQTLVPGAIDALNAVLDVISGTIHDVLGATTLQAPVRQFAACVVGNKVRAAEQALVQLRAALHVALPRVPRVALPAPAALLAPAQRAAHGVARPVYDAVARDVGALQRERLGVLGVLGASVAVLVVRHLVCYQRAL